MKKILAVAAVLLVAAYSFAGSFTNKLNFGGVWTNTNITADEDDADTNNLFGWGANIAWRGTFENGLTLLADLDVIPAAYVVDTDGDSYTAATFAVGVGKEWGFDNGCFAVAGVLGAEAATWEDGDNKDEISLPFLGVNLYGTYMFNKTIGLYGACTAGITFGGTSKWETKYDDGTEDFKSGDFLIAPKFGVVFKF